MAHVKAGGSKASQHSQRAGKRLGVKIYGGQVVKNGMILIRQRGKEIHAGTGTQCSRDFTIHAIKDGTVIYKKNKGTQFVEVHTTAQ